MTIAETCMRNLRALGGPCDEDNVAWWTEEIAAILDREIQPAVLAAAWRRVRAEIDSARREGRWASKPMPETICDAYHACSPPPDLSGCAHCCGGEVFYVDEQGYEIAGACPHCESGAFRRWQASRRSR